MDLKNIFFKIHAHKKDFQNINLLGPFHAQDQMIITKSLNTLNSSGGILTMDEVDECKTLQNRKRKKGKYTFYKAFIPYSLTSESD